MKTKLYRQKSWYKPFYLDIADKSYLLDNIRIYDENGVITEVGRGYFGDNDEELIINGETVRRLKENLTRKENFIVKISYSSIDEETRYCLYIYKDNIDFKDLGEYKQYKTIYHKYSINGIEFDRYVKDLSGKLNDLNKLAEKEVEKLKEMFGYGEEGVDESYLLEIFSKLQDLNRKILDEKKFIQDYEV